MNAKQDEKLLRLEKYNSMVQNKTLKIIDYYRKDRQTFIVVKCFKCNNIMEYYSSNLKALKYCKVCKKQEKIKEYNNKNMNKQFEVIDYYSVNKRIRFIVKCLKCGNIKEYYPCNLTPNAKCENCKKIEKLKEYNINLKGTSLQALDTYIVGDSRIILLKCLKCGKVFKRYGHTINKSISCKYCAKVKRK